MPHTRLDRITFTVYGANENDLIGAARRYITAHVTDVEHWQLSIDAEDAGEYAAGLRGTVVATRRPPPKPAAKEPTP